MLAFALSAAPASAVMVRLPSGRYANYDALSGAKAPKAARIFDAVFQNLDYSGGPIMPSNTNYIVEWLPSNYGAHTPFQTNGGTYTYDYLGGMQKFFVDMAADSGHTTNSDAVSTQYNDTTGAHSAYNFHYASTLVDTDPLPANGCPALPGDICITDAQIQAELNSYLAGQGVPGDMTHEYYLVTPPDIASCFDAAGSSCSGNADQNQAFCAYHSMTSHGYIYSNIPDLSGNGGCDSFAANGYSYDNGPADGMLSAVSHEHNESITDPEPNNAWTDWGSSVGGEIGDKCNNDGLSDPNLQFLGFFDQPYNETINGDPYLIQREWSNQTKGCLDSFTANGTTAAASFIQAAGSGNVVNFSAGASASNPGGVAEYVWQFNDGPASNNGQNTTVETTSPSISHTFPAAGTYNVALTVMNADGTSNGTAHAVMAGHLPPTAAFTGGGGGLEGVPITFNGTGSSDPNPGGSLSYAWNFGDGTGGTGAVISHPFHAGAYTVVLTVTDSASGLTSTVSHGVFVFDEGPSAAFSPPSGRALTPVSFTGSGADPDGSIVSYAWTFGDGASGSGAHVTHTYGAAGNYTVTLKVTDSAGQQSPAVTHVVTIGPVRCVVPKLKGDSLSRARSQLGAAHCAVGKVKSPKKPHRRAGKHKKWVLVVASTNPRAGSVKPRGTKVALNMTWKAVRG
jgi:PKD repeat protein